MSAESIGKTEVTSPNVPERARRFAWLGPPPLFEGEDTAAYDELLARISGAMKPADIFEEFGSEISSISAGRCSGYVV